MDTQDDENPLADDDVGADANESAQLTTASDTASTSGVTRLPLVRDSPSKKSKLPPLKVGDEFSCKDELMRVWAEYSAAQQFGKRVARSSQTKYYLRCTSASCAFDLKAGLTKSGKWNISSFANHTCRLDQRLKATKRQRDGVTPQLIRFEFARELEANPKLSASQATKRLQAKYNLGNVLTSSSQLYYRVHRSLTKLRQESLGDWGTQFRRLRSYLERAKETIGAYYRIDEVKNGEHRRFRRLFWLLDAARDAVSYVRRVLGVDGGHLRNSAFAGVLLMFTCKDAENQIIPLCIGVVESENAESWTWFMQCSHSDSKAATKAKHGRTRPVNITVPWFTRKCLEVA